MTTEVRVDDDMESDAFVDQSDEIYTGFLSKWKGALKAAHGMVGVSGTRREAYTVDGEKVASTEKEDSPTELLFEGIGMGFFTANMVAAALCLTMIEPPLSDSLWENLMMLDLAAFAVWILYSIAVIVRNYAVITRRQGIVKLLHVQLKEFSILRYGLVFLLLIAAGWSAIAWYVFDFVEDNHPRPLDDDAEYTYQRIMAAIFIAGLFTTFDFWRRVGRFFLNSISACFCANCYDL